MSRWDIDAPGVSGVVTRTGERAAGFETSTTSTSNALGGAATSCGSEIVADALAGFSEHIGPDITAVAERTGRIMKAAVDATKAYVAGDLEMAATAQANAAAD